MSLWKELSVHINLGLEAFKQFVEERLQDDPHILTKNFLGSKGELQTILNYLIHHHNERNNLSPFIQWLLLRGKNPNVELPLHLAYELGKFDIAKLILEAIDGVETEDLDAQQLLFDSLNKKGQSLLHLVIDKKNLTHLKILLMNKAPSNQVCEITEPDGNFLALQPLHRAAIRNFPEAIQPLVEAGGQLFNPCGKAQETPLLLAARLKNIDVITAILETHALPDLNKSKPDLAKPSLLHAENKNKQRAIEVLSEYLKQKKSKTEALTGIAVLLCHGSDVPRDSILRNTLKDNRRNLLGEIEKYLKKFPALAAPLLKKCHDKNQVLHDIIYAKSSRWDSLKYLFSKTDDIVFNLESLVEDTNDLSFSQKEIHFSKFVKEYQGAVRRRGCFFNPFSSMLSSIKEGKITDWDAVEKYAEENPKSRTRKILEHMDLSRIQQGPQEQINEKEIRSNQLSL